MAGILGRPARGAGPRFPQAGHVRPDRHPARHAGRSCVQAHRPCTHLRAGSAGRAPPCTTATI